MGINLLINRKKSYKLTKATIGKLVAEINSAIDLKLDGEKISDDNFEVANNFYLSIFSEFEYKYIPNPTHESVLNIIKAFQYIGRIISDCELTEDELTYVRHVLSDIRNIDVSDIFNGIEVKTNEMNLILLNLEIIAYEVKNMNLDKEFILPDKNMVKKLIKPVVKGCFHSGRSDSLLPLRWRWF